MAASAASAAENREVNSYELFIAALSIISIVNIVLSLFLPDSAVREVVVIVDTGLCFVFFADFLGRLRRAGSKSDYFFHRLGWLDLLGSLPLPGLRLARVFRVARVVRLVRAVGMKTIIDKVLHDRAGSALYTVLVLCALVIQYAAIFELLANRGAPHANITTASDAVWYVIVTITTVGYGDTYPVTNAGRIVGVITMFVGVGLFGVLTGFLANTFLAPAKNSTGGESTQESADEPSAQSSQESPALPTSVGLVARLDQLQAEIAELTRLLQHQTSGQTPRSGGEAPDDTHTADHLS